MPFAFLSNLVLWKRFNRWVVYERLPRSEILLFMIAGVIVAAGLQDQRHNLDSVNLSLFWEQTGNETKKEQRYLGGNKERYCMYEWLKEDAQE